MVLRATAASNWSESGEFKRLQERAPTSGRWQDKAADARSNRERRR